MSIECDYRLKVDSTQAFFKAQTIVYIDNNYAQVDRSK